jgi:type IV secretion system protein VirB3
MPVVLARKALIFGVPIVTLLLFLGLILLTAVVGVMSMGFLKGIIIPILLAAGLFSIRVICMDDSRAIEAVTWDLKGAMTRLVCRSSITSFTSVDESIKKRKEVISEFYKINNFK